MNPGSHRGWRLVLVILVAGTCVSLSLTAVSVRGVAADVSDLELPDLDQELPTKVGARAVPGGFQLGFDSEVVNRGPGPLRVSAVRPPGADHMVADQMVRGSGGWERHPNVGRLQYVDSFGHEHWHFMQFQRYELFSTVDQGRVVGDRKQGFCLADAYAPGWCGQGEPDRETIEVGLSVGARDRYKKFVEGQEIPLDRTTTPSGTYVLVNRTDAPRDGATVGLLEATTANNAASVLIELEWPDSASRPPDVDVLETCPDTWDCPAGSGRPAALAEPPPAAPPPRSTRPLTRRRAVLVSRRALRRELGPAPGNPRLRCVRRTPSRFACRVAWRRPAASYRGRVVVWNGVHASYYRAWVTRRRAGCRATAGRCTRHIRRAGRLSHA